MSEETKVVRKGRGIASARGTSRLKFSHLDANPANGLFLAHIERIYTSEIAIGENTTGMPSFNGLTIPRLNIEFASNQSDVNARRFITLTFNAQESNIETIPGGSKSGFVDAIFNWFKHLINVFITKGTRELTDEEVNALTLPFEDFDESGNYTPVEPEVVIAGWKALFENFANMMNTGKDGAPVYQDANHKPLTIWLKLLRFAKGAKKNSKWTPLNGGDLAVPQFVGEGIVELFKQNVKPSLRVNAVRESIIPMKVEEPKAPNIGGVLGAAGGVPIPDFMAEAGNGFNDPTMMAEAAEDMPF